MNRKTSEIAHDTYLQQQLELGLKLETLPSLGTPQDEINQDTENVYYFECLLNCREGRSRRSGRTHKKRSQILQEIIFVLIARDSIFER